MEDNPAPSGAEGEPQGLPFDYIKSQFFRVVHVDGAIGGITPTGQLHIAFYSERPSLPQRLVFAISSEGRLGEPLSEETISRQSIVREMDVDAIMSFDVARRLRDWLNERLQEVDILSVAETIPGSSKH